jgi:succinate dehydrogenase/fumarate reductase flavoprotein subunit
MTRPVTREVDLLVLGAGAGGMTAALTGSVLGLDVMLVERTNLVGGTTAFSAGSVWVPNSRHSPAGADSPDKALRYLSAALGNCLNENRICAFLRAAPDMVAFLEDNTTVALRAYAYHPDYLATLDGATLCGRVLEPVPFDAAVLGKNFATLRPPLPEFTLLGGMMVDRTDIGHLLNATRLPASLLHGVTLVARYLADRIRFPRGTRLVMGNALAGRLYHSLIERHVPIFTSTHTQTLIGTGGRITGAVLEAPDGDIDVRCRCGVILATGGFSHHPALRQQLMPAAVCAHSPVVNSARGEGIELGQRAGGRLSEDHASHSFWAPVSLRPRRDGSMGVFPHFVLDRGKPGVVAVGLDGRRFVNEATSYHQFVQAMYAAFGTSRPQSCFLVCDDDFIVKYGLGMVRPRRLNLRRAIADGYVTRAATLADLAASLGLPPASLEATIARHNGFARTGLDEDFAKGSDAYQRNVGDPAHGPNPCIGPIAKPPFYALRLNAGDIGASTGLVTNEFAQVLRADGSVVPGLYACGNDMASIMAGIYPGPGVTIGPAMTFGYIAAHHAHAEARRLAAAAAPAM